MTMELTSTLSLDHTFTSRLIDITRAAGAAILAIYNAPETANIQTKNDDSPLTAADLAAHQLIVRELPGLLDVPVISEESALPSLAERQAWSTYWLVDPLDGTKEFIARNGQFTVNIALIVNTVPLLGVVHVPVTDETYLGVDKSLAEDELTRAEKYVNGIFASEIKTQSVGKKLAENRPLNVLMSLRHGSREQTELVARLQSRWPVPLNPLNVGSSLKFCWIAEGRADFYPRLGPTSEWDTAAAQAVLTAAGGMVVEANGFRPLRCNTRETVLNPFFLAMGDASFDWQSLLV
ncbi:3'(2'),5'-bisphosphate nucleotidase CysQ [Cellvibrio zantedeschiae]|uniref:3'(2'),5'-bisphosphate nucleotidase CysQ n=1 Tax=Cellvibrio zantedeschiae TaxID=1237077 RepID=A0ABQ3BBU4_9GAMM|nr:3'(2'),5'-bisphosphate nucleotidase CysQ [Cellvibrio zantedeschiae]GGY83445.1 3'(2'),5'-bisphosphate nucleotidase CysQ [Cellvibrio zantedeschiae]